MSLINAVQRKAQEDVFRLKSVELWIPSDEQTAKAREKVPDIKVHASLKVVWEPMTYRKFIGDEQVTEEVDYIKLTKGNGLSEGDEAANIARARESGFLGISPAALLTVPNVNKSDPDKQPQPFPRFMIYATRAGISIEVDEDGSVTGQVGQFYTPQAGQIFKCRNGAEDFPVPGEVDGKFRWNWDEPRSTFMRIPLEVVKDFVQPDDIREQHFERKEDNGGAPVTTTSAPVGVTPEQLAAAVAALGISGKAVGMVNTSAVSLIASGIAKHPAVFGSTEVSKAAQSGKFVDYLVEKGVAQVENGTVIVG